MLNSLREALRVYAVTDRAWLDRAPAACATLERQVEEAVAGGVTMVQLREKALDEAAFGELARRVRRVTAAFGVPLIINDSLSVALASGAEGLHVGQTDGDVAAARAALGPDRWLGVSVQTVEQARAAEAAGADYLGVGAVFPTATKPDAAEVAMETLRAICAAVRIPVVAIGGITLKNVASLAETGIAGVAVVSAVFGDPGRTRAAAEELCAAVGCDSVLLKLNRTKGNLGVRV